MIHGIRLKLRQWKSRSPFYLDRLISQWERMHRHAIPLNPTVGSEMRLLIIPCDPWTVTGSRGDQAMIAGVVDTLRQRGGVQEVAIVVATREAAYTVQRAGFRALRLWPVAQADFQPCLSRLREYAPHACVALGADTMDGFYSPSSTLRLLCLADLMARDGVHTCILGFSFNRQPVAQIAHAFQRVSSKLLLNVRDARSLQRFEHATHTHARLVADAAFLMQPDATTPQVDEVRQFVVQQRTAGRDVLAINAHPMLFLGQATNRVGRLQQALAQALDALMRQRPIALLLLSHDDRAGHGDTPFLQALHETLSPEWTDRLLLPRRQMSAPELKASAALVSGVVSGRMHLAVAALGSGVPVAALTYQDKFEGLFDHFGLDAQWLRSGEAALDAPALSRWMLDFFDALGPLTTQVRERLPQVLRLATTNFDGVFPPLPSKEYP